MAIFWGKMVDGIEAAGQAASEDFSFLHPTGDYATDLGSERHDEARKSIASLGLPLRVCSVPLSREVRVTQRGFNLYVWMEHLKHAIARLADLGCTKLTWSDGRARLMPIEGESDGPKGQVLQFLSMLCTAASAFDITVCVEPLGPRRTNFLNSMQELDEFLSRVGRENLSAALSFRELEPIGLALPELSNYRPLVGHLQLDNPQSYDGAHACPLPDDGVDYLPFIRSLKAAGFAGEISLPGDASAKSLDYCRSLWDA